MSEVPVFINCRDRVTPLVELVDYLERAGCERVYMLDNASTYPPLLEYYEQTPHTVIPLGENRPHKSFWESGLLDELDIRSPYVFSDPDTIPIEECPLDAIEYFAEVLDHYPAYQKVGFGLRIDDLPDHYRLKTEVITWESRFYRRLVAPRLYEAPIDTTFALYRGPDHARAQALRTGYPYLVRHTTWYLDSDNLPAEDLYYIEHASGVTSWTRHEIGAGAEGSPPERSDRMREKLTRFAAQSSEAHAVDPKSRHGFADFAAALLQFVEPRTVVVTSTAQEPEISRVTAQIRTGQRLRWFESDDDSRAALLGSSCFDGVLCNLSEDAAPDDSDYAFAAMSVLASALDRRVDEVTAWWRAAPHGALALIHCRREDQASSAPDESLAALIDELRIPGVFLKNPGGAYLGLKPA